MKLLFILLISTATCYATPTGKVRILQHHKRHSSFQDLISYIATSDHCYDGKKTYVCPDDLIYEDLFCNEGETTCFKKFANSVDVIYSPSENWNLAHFTKVNTELFNNILSYRVPVLLKKNLPLFLESYRKNEIKKISLVFNRNWRDFQLLSTEGYQLVPVESYSAISESLLKQKGVYSLRGVSEISFEPDFTSDRRFVALYDHLVFYPFETHLYINHVNNPHALSLFHRILYFQRFNPELLRSFFASHLPLEANKPCFIYDGRTNIKYRLKKCAFEKLQRIESLSPHKESP